MKNLLAEHVSVTNMKKKKKSRRGQILFMLKAEHKRDGFTKIKQEVTN